MNVPKDTVFACLQAMFYEYDLDEQIECDASAEELSKSSYPADCMIGKLLILMGYKNITAMRRDKSHVKEEEYIDD